MRLTRRGYILLGSLLLVALIATGASLVNSTTPTTLPVGTPIVVRLDHALASDQQRPGDEFRATVAASVPNDEDVVIPKGASVIGRVLDARESGRLKGIARLNLTLTSVQVNGTSYDLETSGFSRFGGNHNKNNLGWIGGGAGAGTVIGAIAAGGKGALIGGPVGAGLGVAMFTGKRDIRLPAESQLAFRLKQPLTVDVKR